MIESICIPAFITATCSSTFYNCAAFVAIKSMNIRELTAELCISPRAAASPSCSSQLITYCTVRRSAAFSTPASHLEGHGSNLPGGCYFSVCVFSPACVFPCGALASSYNAHKFTSEPKLLVSVNVSIKGFLSPFVSPVDRLAT